MAEIIGIISSVLTLLHAARKTNEYRHDFFHAREQQDKLIDDLEKMMYQAEALYDLEKRLRENPNDTRLRNVRAMFSSSVKQDAKGKELAPDPLWQKLGTLHQIATPMREMKASLENRPQGQWHLFSNRALWHQRKKKHRETLGMIRAWTDDVNRLLNPDVAQAVLDIGDDMKSLVKNSRKQAVENWLSPLEFRKVQSEIYNECTKNHFTTPGLMRTVEFDAWSKGRPWMLWCIGDPGSGKTWLSSWVIEYMRHLPGNEEIPVLGIFLSYSDKKAQSRENLLGSLLKQLLQHTGVAHFKSGKANGLLQGVENESRPTLGQLTEAFKHEVQEYRRVILVVDAYDEAAPNEKQAILDLLFELLDAKVNVMMTTRPNEVELQDENDVFCDICQKENLKIYYECQLHDGFLVCQDCKNEGKTCSDPNHSTLPLEELYTRISVHIKPSDTDITQYVEKELADELALGARRSIDRSFAGSAIGTTSLGRIFRGDKDLSAQIIPKVVKMANGMFTLAGLYIQTLRECDTISQIKKILDRPPDGYDGFYERSMSRITDPVKGNHSVRARKIMQWVVCTHRLLSLSEIVDALAVDLSEPGFDEEARIDEQTIVDITAGLVCIDTEKTVKLKHRTAREYLDATRDRWFPNASAEVAQVCLHYIGIDALSTPCSEPDEETAFRQRKQKFPFLHYAFLYWGAHAREASLDAKTHVAIWNYVRSPSSVASCVQANWYLRSTETTEWVLRRGANALFLCAWFGLGDAISRLLDQGFDINSVDPKYGQTPIIYSCRRGHKDVVSQLLERGADINWVDCKGSFPLFEAIENNRLELVQMLCTIPSLDPNMKHVGRMDCTALLLATETGNLEIVNAILGQQSININQQDSRGDTALTLAARLGLQAILDSLLTHEEVDLSIANEQGRTALIVAASIKNSDPRLAAGMCKSLLRKGASALDKDLQGGAAIQRAVDAGNEEVVKLLLQNHADASIVDEYQRGLLHSAAINGETSILCLLLKQGLDKDGRDKHRRTPLHSAARAGSYDSVKELLDAGADKALKDEWERTPKYVAWQNNRIDIVQLLSNNSDPQDDEPPTRRKTLPMWSLASLGREDDIKSLIDKSPQAILPLDPDSGNTAIHCAVSAQPTSALDSKGKAKFHARQASILSRLLDAGLSAAATNDSFRTPLHLAALYGNVDCMAILLQDPEVQEHIDDSDRWLDSPLTIAYKTRNIGCALALVENGAVPQHESRTMVQTLFLAAIEANNLAAAKALKDHGADLSTKDLIGRRPMEIAEDANAKDVLKYLKATPTTMPQPVRLDSDATDASLDSALEMRLLSLRDSPFQKPWVWKEEDKEDGGTQATHDSLEDLEQLKVPTRLKDQSEKEARPVRLPPLLA